MEPTTEIRRPSLGLLLALCLLPCSGLRAGPVHLGDPFPISAGRFTIRPLEGMRFQPPNTPGVEAFFVGEIEDRGPSTMLVLYLPEVGGLPTTEKGAEAHLAEVAEGLDDAAPLGVRLVEGGGVEMDFEITQLVGGTPRRMYMIQRQLEAEEGLYSLTAVCLKESAAELGEALQRCLASFTATGRGAPAAAPLPTPRDAADRLRLAGALIPQGRLQEAHDLAAGMEDSAPFLERVGAFRVRFAALLGMARFPEARALVGPYVGLWRGDDRAFSAHYSWLLRQGTKDFLQRLHGIERSDLEPGAKAALAQVAVTVWAGPAESIPPHLTETQDRFFEALRRVGETQGPGVSLAWKALEPSLRSAASEVEDFLRRAADTGRVLGPAEADYQWLESSLFLPLVASLEAGDRRRFDEVLDLYSKVRGATPALFDPADQLRRARGELVEGEAVSLHEMAYRIWSSTGSGLYARTEALLEKEGLDGLLTRGAAMLEGRR